MIWQFCRQKCKLIFIYFYSKIESYNHIYSLTLRETIWCFIPYKNQYTRHHRHYLARTPLEKSSWKRQQYKPKTQQWWGSKPKAAQRRKNPKYPRRDDNDKNLTNPRQLCKEKNLTSGIQMTEGIKEARNGNWLLANSIRQSRECMVT